MWMYTFDMFSLIQFLLYPTLCRSVYPFLLCDGTFPNSFSFVRDRAGVQPVLMSSVIGVIVPISLLPWVTLSALAHPPPHAVMVRSMRAWGWEHRQCSPVKLSVCTVQTLWIICMNARPSGNINNSHSICLPWWASVLWDGGETDSRRDREIKRCKTQREKDENRTVRWKWGVCVCVGGVVWGVGA